MKNLVSRFLQMAVILSVLSVVLFGLLSAMPGNPVDMLITSNPRVKPEDIVRLKKLRGLDKPWYVQYYKWVYGSYDPLRPPVIETIEAQTFQLAESGENVFQIDLSSYLSDPDRFYSKQELLGKIEKEQPTLFKEIQEDGELYSLSEGAVLGYLFATVAGFDDGYYEQIQKDIRTEGLLNLTVKGIFGSKAEGFSLSQSFSEAGEQKMWFIATDKNGLESVGSILVKAEGFGNTEQKVDSLWAIDPIPNQIVDDPSKFSVDLRKYILGVPEVEALTFGLLNPDDGHITDKGVFTKSTPIKGQKSISYYVENARKQRRHGAFAIEEVPLPNLAEFQPGFVYGFLGYKEALGFSNTYKQPVWDLLMGTPSYCGNGDVEAGESCDDDNIVPGDGCSKTCQIEGQGFAQRTEIFLKGFFSGSGRIGNTILLMLPALLLSLMIALPLGIISAYRQYSILDYIVNFLAFIGISLPVFWFGIMLIFLFGEKFQLFPAGGIQTPGIMDESLWVIIQDRFEHLVLPTCVLSIAYAGRWLRYMRSSMLEVLPADYIRTARAKGLSEKVVILKHALRNALIPVVTVMALSIPQLFGGAMLTETVFAWPGIGRLQFESVMNSDYYVAIVVFLVTSLLVMLGNLLADFLYVLVDPRIRHR